MITTTKGMMNPASLRKVEGIVDDYREHTEWVEYWDGDELVHRSVAMQLKEGALTNASAANFSGDQVIANSAGMCTSFKKELLNGSHAFGTQGANAVRTVTTKDVFNLALFLVSASRTVADTVYNTTGELAASGNYTQGGVACTNATAPTTSGTTGYWTPSASATWTALTSSGAFDCAVLYNATSTSKLECAVFTFGSQSIVAGDFSLTMPINAAATALIQIA